MHKNNLLNHKIVSRLSLFMKFMCYIAMLLLTGILILAFRGRLEYTVHTADGNYTNSFYTQETSDSSTGVTTITSDDQLHIYSTDKQIEFVTFLSITAMYTLGILPLIFAYFLLSKIFANLEAGAIFIKKNADYLLYYALIKIAVTLLLPFIKMLFFALINKIGTDTIYISTGSDFLNDIMPSIAFLIAVYIIQYGVSLQDEVDATL
ncbi:MAG: DUF2975 domain-containing protein [Lachnospiraceae bacterium]